VLHDSSDAYSSVLRGHAEIPLTVKANSANLSRRSPNFAIITNRHAANLIEVAALSFLRPRKDPTKRPKPIKKLIKRSRWSAKQKFLPSHG